MFECELNLQSKGINYHNIIIILVEFPFKFLSFLYSLVRRNYVIFILFLIYETTIQYYFTIKHGFIVSF